MNLSIALGLLADEVLPEPPNRWHPVAWFGSTMQRVEQKVYRDTKVAGVTHAVIGVALGAGAGLVLNRVFGRRNATTLAVAIASGGAMLRAVATDIGVAGSVEEARHRLPSLVGRDPSTLDEGEIARAVVESVAENTVDAVMATVFWAAIGGAPTALAHRAVNTMDAMVGHLDDRYRNYGWASARLDDVTAWVPARLTALATLALRPQRRADIVASVRHEAPQHPSPNSGVAEAAFAAALDLRLGGTNRYGDEIQHRVLLHPAGHSPTLAAIAPAASLSRTITALAAAVSLLAR